MRSTRAVAVNVGANTNSPGFRGPIFPDGSFEFVPIPESEPTREPVPTYADLPVSIPIPEALRNTPVHLDPSFDGYGPAEGYTYGDPWGVKARPLLDLSADDRVYFYATLTPHDPVDDPVTGTAAPWIAPDWGAYLIGRFVLAEDPVTGDRFHDLPASRREVFTTNAHVRRETFDAAVLLEGDPARSGLLSRAIPLSSPTAGAEPNRVVTAWSADSGRGPWWRRPLRFDPDGTATLESLRNADDDRLRALAE